jgi:hypothetical protein
MATSILLADAGVMGRSVIDFDCTISVSGGRQVAARTANFLAARCGTATRTNRLTRLGNSQEGDAQMTQDFPADSSLVA